MITKYVMAIMIVITLVCFLSFCEEPMHEQRQPEVIQKKEQPPPTSEPETKADPEGFSGMF